MSQPSSGSGAATTGGGLVRVTVMSTRRRVDLALPASVPVAELVPELARSVGLLDPASAYGGFRVTTGEGRPLDDSSGLVFQGVTDGSVLTVAAVADDETPRVYDDVVEAMTDAVEGGLSAWDPTSGRRTALGAASLLLALGIAALFVMRGSDLAAATGGVIAGVLVVAAIACSRSLREPEAALTLSWTAAGYAAVAGYLAAPEPLDSVTVLGYVGASLALASTVCVVGLAERRPLAAPPAALGSLLGLTAVVVEFSGFSAGQVVAVVLTVVVMSGSLFPWLALNITSTQVDQMVTTADITADPRPIDPALVSADAELAHQILLAIIATVGLLLIVSAPLLVDLGLLGTALALTACVVMLLRTRQYRVSSEVAVGLSSGALGAAAVAGWIVLTRDEWSGPTAVALAGAGAALLVGTLVPAGSSVRRGRLGDVAESIGLVALVPLAALAIGLIGGG